MKTTSNYKWIVLQYDDDAGFFMLGKTRYDLCDFMRVDGEKYHAVLTLSNCFAMGIEISSCGDGVRVFWLS